MRSIKFAIFVFLKETKFCTSNYLQSSVKLGFLFRLGKVKKVKKSFKKIWQN